MSDSNPVQESEEVAVQNRYKGARYRKWGRWVSEIRVPGTKERLWLGSYITAEAAAVAHDVATYCLRGPSSIESLNFPLLLPANVQQDMSPRSVKRAASDAGMAMDAQMIMILKMCDPLAQDVNANENNAGQGIQQQELGNE